MSARPFKYELYSSCAPIHRTKYGLTHPAINGFIAQLLERRSDQEELTVTLSSQILTETRSQVDRAPMASASAQDRVSFASGLARSERGERGFLAPSIPSSQVGREARVETRTALGDHRDVREIKS